MALHKSLTKQGRSAAPRNFGDRRVSFFNGPRSIQNKPFDRMCKRAQSDEAASGAPASNAPPEPTPPLAPVARSICLVDMSNVLKRLDEIALIYFRGAPQSFENTSGGVLKVSRRASNRKCAHPQEYENWKCPPKIPPSLAATRAQPKQNFADALADAPSRSTDAKADAGAKIDDSRQFRVKNSEGGEPRCPLSALIICVIFTATRAASSPSSSAPSPRGSRTSRGPARPPRRACTRPGASRRAPCGGCP